MILKDVTAGVVCHDLPTKKLDYTLENPAFMAVDKTWNIPEHPFLEQKPRKLLCLFNGFYLKNKAGLTGNFVRMKNSYKRGEQLCKFHGPAVQGVDNAIHRINHYPVDKCQQNKLCYPLVAPELKS